jgi:hypothetical protein
MQKKEEESCRDSVKLKAGIFFGELQSESEEI